MSYVIHVWELPAPSTLNEAKATQAALAAEAGATPAALLALQAHVRRACAAVVGETPAAIRGLAEDPLSGPLLSLSLPPALVARLQPLVLREALALGLVALDERAGVCVHPNGHLLGAEGSQTLGWAEWAQWAPSPMPQASATVSPVRNPRALVPTAAMLAWRDEQARNASFQTAMDTARVGDIDPRGFDRGWFQGRITRQLLPWLQRHGFEDLSQSSDMVFKRLTPAGLQTVSISCSSSFQIGTTGPVVRLNYRLEPWLPAALNEIPGLAGSIHLEIPPHAALAWTTLELGHDMGCRVRHRGDLDCLLRSLRDVLTDEVLPLLNACRTPTGILTSVREPDRLPTRLRFSPTVLGLAHWAGDTDFHSLLLHQWQRASRAGALANTYLWVAQGLRAKPALFGAMPQLKAAG